jgi:two-component system, OmpR family, sensor histidine kinase KdpD
MEKRVRFPFEMRPNPQTGAPDVKTRPGRLKVYLGATPGAGKTYAMLHEAHQLVAHGHDVAVGYVETYNRPRTVDLLADLEVVPRLKLPYKGTVLEEMDLDAVLVRKPEIVLVDELAHTNVPSLRHAKRWEDVEELRAAGIDVITTVNVQHVESVKDLVEKVTGIVVRETVPDRELDGADEIQFIDITPEALRKRMRHGNVYARDKVETALANFFRPQNLSAMRQIGLRLVADSMARSRHVLASPEDVLVAVSGGLSSEDLIRRGSRLARRLGGTCMVVTVQSEATPSAHLMPYRMLATQLGASFAVLGGSDVAAAVIQAARDSGVEHVVVGEMITSSVLNRLRPTVVDRILDQLPSSDVHVIARLAQ